MRPSTPPCERPRCHNEAIRMAFLDILTAWPRRPCTHTGRPDRKCVATAPLLILYNGGHAMNGPEQERKVATCKGHASSTSNDYAAAGGQVGPETQHKDEGVSENKTPHDEETTSRANTLHMPLPHIQALRAVLLRPRLTWARPRRSGNSPDDAGAHSTKKTIIPPRSSTSKRHHRQEPSTASSEAKHDHRRLQPMMSNNKHKHTQ